MKLRFLMILLCPVAFPVLVGAQGERVDSEIAAQRRASIEAHRNAIADSVGRNDFAAAEATVRDRIRAVPGTLRYKRNYGIRLAALGGRFDVAGDAESAMMAAEAAASHLEEYLAGEEGMEDDEEIYIRLRLGFLYGHFLREYGSAAEQYRAVLRLEPENAKAAWGLRRFDTSSPEQKTHR